jgi:signal transduction histidine kinase
VGRGWQETIDVAEQAPTYFRVVAVDFDGTLADGPVAPGTLAVLAEARARQVRVILVTGRIMSELRTVFPQVDDYVDAVVTENGAVLADSAGIRRLDAPVSRAVCAGLAARDVAHRCGQVLMARAAADEPTASGVIRELGLDCQFAQDRDRIAADLQDKVIQQVFAVGMNLHSTAMLRLQPHRPASTRRHATYLVRFP